MTPARRLRFCALSREYRGLLAIMMLFASRTSRTATTRSTSTRVPPEDVSWVCGLLSQLTSAQWRSAFRAAGYEPAVSDRFIRSLRAKIEDGRRLEPHRTKSDRVWRRDERVYIDELQRRHIHVTSTAAVL